MNKCKIITLIRSVTIKHLLNINQTTKAVPSVVVKGFDSVPLLSSCLNVHLDPTEAGKAQQYRYCRLF